MQSKKERSYNMKKVYVNWETDGMSIKELGLPSKVNVPKSIDVEEIADWLSDKYGFLVESFYFL